jgi:hypothetical protein
MITSDDPTLLQRSVRVASVPGVPATKPIAERLNAETSSVEVALVPILIVSAAPVKATLVRNWMFRMWLYAGMTMPVEIAVDVPFCVIEAVCAIATKPTLRSVPTVVPVVLKTSPALMGPEKVEIATAVLLHDQVLLSVQRQPGAVSRTGNPGIR